MSNLDNALRELREKRSHAQVEIDKLDQIISGIESLNGTGAATPGKATKPKHTMSAAGRRKISLAQKKRWAKARNVVSIASKRGKGISAAGRKRIAAAQRARWAKIRAAKKTA